MDIFKAAETNEFVCGGGTECKGCELKSFIGQCTITEVKRSIKLVHAWLEEGSTASQYFDIDMAIRDDGNCSHQNAANTASCKSHCVVGKYLNHDNNGPRSCPVDGVVRCAKVLRTFEELSLKQIPSVIVF